MTARPPLITVLLCVYNGSRYLAKSIESILQQTFSDFEFLIIDDGSTDATPEIIAAYTDPRIRILRQDHSGLTEALQRGLAEARGEFLARLDADDLAHPERLRTQIALFHRQPEIVLIGSDALRIDADGNVLRRTYLPSDSVLIKWRLLFYNCIPHSSVMFRTREVRQLGGYTTTVRFAQDYELWLRLAARYRVGGIPEPLVSCRIPGPTALSSVYAEEQQRFFSQTQESLLFNLDPSLCNSLAAVQELGRFLFLGGPPPTDIDQAENLCRRLGETFKASTFAAGEPDAQLRTIMLEPYLHFAWRYCALGQIDDCRRCLRAALACGMWEAVPLPELPEEKLDTACALITESIKDFSCTKRANSSRARSLLCEQNLSCAWQWYHRGDLRRFRRYLLRAWAAKPRGTILLWWLRSFLGKRLFEELHSMRQQLQMILQKSSWQDPAHRCSR